MSDTERAELERAELMSPSPEMTVVVGFREISHRGDARTLADRAHRRREPIERGDRAAADPGGPGLREAGKAAKWSLPALPGTG